MPVLPGLTIRVVQIEDIIGLKVQALVNNPAREIRDWADIHMILEARREQGARSIGNWWRTTCGYFTWKKSFRS